MKPKESVALATWILEHFTFGPHREALSGDLLEEFRHGRSAGWYRRQVVFAIAMEAIRKSRDYALPLIFSVAWSMFYPACWFCIAKLRLTQIGFERWAAVDWPYSTGLQGISGIVPAVLFVWLGLAIYLMLRTAAAHELSWFQLFGSLSISLNVLFVVTIGLWIHLKSSGISLSYEARDNLYSNSYLFAICIPLALSLLSAIASALPRRHHGGSAFLAG